MGDQLFKTLIEQTGLPGESLSKELLGEVMKKGYKKESLTLDQIREILSEYLQEILLEAKKEFR